MTNAFDGLLGRLDKAKERICELENISIETSPTEQQRENGGKFQSRVAKDCRTATKAVTCL